MSTLAEAWHMISLCQKMTYNQIDDNFTRWNETTELVGRTKWNTRVIRLTDAQKIPFHVIIGAQVCKRKTIMASISSPRLIIKKFKQQREVDRELLHHHRMTEEITEKFVSLKKIVETNSMTPSISAWLVSRKFSTNTILPTQFEKAQLEFGEQMLDFKSEHACKPVTCKHHFKRKAA